MSSGYSLHAPPDATRGGVRPAAPDGWNFGHVVIGVWREVRGEDLIVPHLQSFARRRDECSPCSGNVAQNEQLDVKMISSR